jgi:hypothetical protein
MVGIIVSLGQARFQTGAAGIKYVESRLDTRLFNLQLTAPLLAQVFRMRTAHSRQGLLNILRLHIFFELAQASLQFLLLSLNLDQLRAEIGGALFGSFLSKDRRQTGNQKRREKRNRVSHNRMKTRNGETRKRGEWGRRMMG